MKKLLFYAFVLLLSYSCVEETKQITIDQLSGLVQKGPFNNGATITIYELNESFGQTGRSFKSEIKNNSGLFEISNLTLESPYVLVEASGFYFNECTGENSEAQLTLSAVANIEDQSTLNVNLLSHLEKDRVLKLVSEGTNFEDAKHQVQEEILSVFELDSKTDSFTSEQLDISKDGEMNAKLLAISAIVQITSSTSDLSKLLAEIKSDLYEDGEITSDAIGIQLISQALLVDTEETRELLSAKYNLEGIDAEVPDFESAVKQFIENTGYEAASLIEYPDSTNYGKNILNSNLTEVYTEEEYSMAINLKAENSVKIVLSGGLWSYMGAPKSPIGWNIDEYDWDTNTQVFTSIEGIEQCDLIIMFSDRLAQSDTITIDYYEDGSTEPTITKKIHINKPDYSNILIIPETGQFGTNLLSLAISTEDDTIQIESGIKYSFEFELPIELDILTLISFTNNGDSVNASTNMNEIYNFESSEYNGEYRYYITWENTPQIYSGAITFNEHGSAVFSAGTMTNVSGEHVNCFSTGEKVLVW